MDTLAAKARCEAATEGPWWLDEYCRKHGGGHLQNTDGGTSIILPCEHPDTEFILHARSDLPAALERITELEESYIGRKWNKLAKERDAALEAVLMEALAKVRRTHTVCDDGWYSCPKSGECIREDGNDDCDCGADRANAVIDAALADPSPAAAALLARGERARNALVAQEDWENHWPACDDCYAAENLGGSETERRDRCERGALLLGEAASQRHTALAPGESPSGD